MTLSRRDFLRRTALVSAAAASGSALGGCGNDVNPAPFTDGAVGDDGIVQLELARYPDLQPVGGALTVRLAQIAAQANSPFVVPPAILVVHHDLGVDETHAFTAMDSACPHAGCPLGYSASARRVECPCHSSQFRVVADPAVPSSCAGDVLHAPAVQGPRVYASAYDGRLVSVDLSSTSPDCQKFPVVQAGTLTIPIAGTPLDAVGGSIIGAAGGFGLPLAVVRVDAHQLVALSARCTHLGCTVLYNAGKREFDCPCHRSAYALDGSVLRGPAVEPLTQFAVEIDGPIAIITLTS
jgi:Rieske Fe-S protein